MRLNLRFGGLETDLDDAVTEVQLVDLAAADAPADVSGHRRLEPFSVAADRPWVILETDVEPDPEMAEPAVVVRVRARVGGGGHAAGRTATFVNTTATPVRGTGGSYPVAVDLDRVD